MKLKNIIAVLLLVASVQAFGQSNAGMQRMTNGVLYRIYTKNDNPKIKLNDVITFNFVQKTDKDSVLFSSFEAGRPAQIQVQESKNIADLMTVFPLLAATDSALIKVPTDSLFKGAEDQRPPFFPKGSYLSFVLKIEKVQSLEEAMAEQQKVMNEMKSQEAAALAKYAAGSSTKFTATNSGLRYAIARPSVKAKPMKGDTVLVNYIGRTLNGKLFDTSIEAEAKKAGLEQPGRNYEPISVVVGQGQVIPGWDEGLLLFNEGAKGSLLIPSDLAYGARGAGEDIAPFSPLLFDVEIVKVKRVKRAATPAKPATTVKKPVSKTPVKKPASTTVKKPTSTTKAPVKK
ncbi:FKBP-type peptidyl-prolyl cis-trans isomerase [Pedobacter sp. SYSU D00535]|uniref:FKBP-type peptidyl-prolyl cis-trans isomerase n=1 Tax=Pedobacter sp. SYSU D00535 TaxID=2810308 RepID=UPI001A96B3D2|nr:FKBP-type peptidyl-prolyl cis-trans isomerase [Pedobacter sp. SYSU D00535]